MDLDRKNIPLPKVMPVDRKTWLHILSNSNFQNAAAEYSDILSLPDISTVLVIGPGQGLDVAILRWRDYVITTFDIDQTFSPDYVGSVHDLSQFSDKQFDLVIASHVLEHLPVMYLNKSLRELARVARYALVFLPLAGRHFQFRLKADVKGFDYSIFFSLYNFIEKPDGVTPRYCAGQHFWEIGYRGFRKKDLIVRLETSFKIIRHYRNINWNPSYNFVLESKG